VLVLESGRERGSVGKQVVCGGSRRLLNCSIPALRFDQQPAFRPVRHLSVNYEIRPQRSRRDAVLPLYGPVNRLRAELARHGLVRHLDLILSANAGQDQRAREQP
jgi:hypothetical protein